jgi:CubicO group peptidase (beta-lactamase class C family)
LDSQIRLAVLLVVAIGAGAFGAPAQTLDDWPVSTPSREGIEPATLERLDRIQLELPHLRSLLIARHGRLVFERYYGGASRDELQNIQSMTKSISSALVGIALRKGLISSLDAKVADYFPEYRDGIRDDRMKTISIRHLLTMSSGIDEMQLIFDKALSNPIAEILRQPLLYLPGGGFRYSSPAAHLLGGVLRKAAGQEVLTFAETELFRPLGIGKVVWYADRTGLQSGGMSALCRSRDLLKFGELYLRKGAWGGRKIVPSAFVADSVQIHNTGEFYGERVRYGYMWWISDVSGHRGFYARGYGGQFLVVLPDLDLVVACTSDWKQPEYPDHFALLERFIVPSTHPE